MCLLGKLTRSWGLRLEIQFEVEKPQDRTALDAGHTSGNQVPDVGQSPTSTPSSNRGMNQDNLVEGNDVTSQKPDEKLRTAGEDATVDGAQEVENAQRDVLKTPEDNQHLGYRYYTTKYLLAYPEGVQTLRPAR